MAILDPSTLLTAIVGAGLTYKLYKVVHNIFFHPLSRFPGPIYLAASHLPRSFYQVRGQLPYIVKDLHDKYGSVVRVSPTELSFISATAFTDIYDRRNPQNPKDETIFSLSDGLEEKPIGFADDENHARQRAHLSHAFSAQGLDEQLPLLRSYIDFTISRLKVRAHSGQPTDIAAWMNWLTFDIIGDLVLGEPFSCLANENYHPWINVIFEGLVGLAAAIELNRYGLLKLIEPLIPKSMQKGRRDMVEYTTRLTRKRLELGETLKPDFVTLMSRGSKKGDAAMTEGERFGNAEALIVAGSNTVATLLSSAVFLGVTHPQKMARVSSEVRNAFKSDSIEMNFRSVSKLPYMMAFLDEVLRYHPSVPNGLARKSVDKGVVVDGTFIPPETTINIYHFASFRTKQNWVRPGEFVPERWLPEGAEEFAQDEKNSFKPFSIGVRSCLGRSLAEVEARLIFANLLWHFDFELCPDQDGWLEGQKAYFIWEKKELYMKVKERPISQES